MAGTALVNQVMPSSAVVSASQFHTVAWVEVQLSSNPKDKDVYKQGSQKKGDTWEDTYAITGVGLSKLMNAAGITEVHSHKTDDGRHPYIVSWQFRGKWVQPDSTEIEYSGDYTCDLRDWITIPSENGEEPQKVRGARFERAYLEDRDMLMRKKFPNETKGAYGDALATKVGELLAKMTPEARQEIEETAESFALRRIVASRPFVTQLAQTGAMDRCIRKFLQLKATYTHEELSIPFSVPRSRFDWDRLDAVLGKEHAGELKMAEAMKLLKIDPAMLQQLKQLSAPAPKPDEPVMPGDAKPPADFGDLGGMPAPEAESPNLEKVSPKELGGEKYVAFQDVTEGVLAYRKWADGCIEVQAMGTLHPAKEPVGKNLSPIEKNAIADLFKTNGKVNTFEMAGHLKKHFQVGTISALTWEQLAAMFMHKEGKGDDPRWYPPEPKADPICEAYGIKDTTTEDADNFLKAVNKLKDHFCLVPTMAKYNLNWEQDHERLASLACVLSQGVVEFGSEEFENLAKNGVPF